MAPRAKVSERDTQRLYWFQPIQAIDQAPPPPLQQQKKTSSMSHQMEESHKTGFGENGSAHEIQTVSGAFFKRRVDGGPRKLEREDHSHTSPSPSEQSVEQTFPPRHIGSPELPTGYEEPKRNVS
uniref:Uncharacterized protein n=1 Tax=Coccidioides posadasii RMSCC 3488 TaxID=454284 RepID=A0A0J6FH07_COCPO|nr:hypothetical protein CPAG_08730 [Coccidioides posadasii RMSCC 3488]